MVEVKGEGTREAAFLIFRARGRLVSLVSLVSLIDARRVCGFAWKQRRRTGDAPVRHS